MASKLACAGVRSAPKKPAPAALSNGSKLPRHSKPAPTRFSASHNNHNNKGAHHVTTPDNGFAEITHRELGLRRQLTSGQMSMIAIGGAIGTGLFMGSAYAIGYAGPSVLVS